jgi:hypothetical protein
MTVKGAGTSVVAVSDTPSGEKILQHLDNPDDRTMLWLSVVKPIF